MRTSTWNLSRSSLLWEHDSPPLPAVWGDEHTPATADSCGIPLLTELLMASLYSNKLAEASQLLLEHEGKILKHGTQQLSTLPTHVCTEMKECPNPAQASVEKKDSFLPVSPTPGSPNYHSSLTGFPWEHHPGNPQSLRRHWEH